MGEFFVQTIDRTTGAVKGKKALGERTARSRFSLKGESANKVPSRYEYRYVVQVIGGQPQIEQNIIVRNDSKKSQIGHMIYTPLVDTPFAISIHTPLSAPRRRIVFADTASQARQIPVASLIEK